MLYFLLSWCLLFGVSLALGAVVFADLAPRSPDRLLDRTLIAVWLGIGVTAIVLLLVSFVTPISPVVGLALLVTVMIRSAVQWRDLKDAIVPAPDAETQIPPIQITPIKIPPIKISKRALLGLGLVAVGLAAWLDRPVVWNDTGYYHYSLIQWLGTYGTVPGLSLLFNNLGFTSAWFALATPFNPVIFEGRAVAVTNGFAFLLLLLQWAIAVRSIAQKQGRLADYFSVVWGALLIPVTLFLKPLSEILISPSPDLPVTILVGTIAWVMLLVGDRPVKHGDTHDRLIPVMLAVMAVSFKLIALPLLPITLLFALWRQPGRVWLYTGLLTFCGLLPLIMGNLITSGCPLYPSNLLCLDLPWTPSKTAIAQVAQGTHGWTTWYGTPPPGTNPWLWSLGAWWASSSKEKITAIGIVLAVVSAVLVIGRSLVIGRGMRGLGRVTRKLDDRPELWVSLVGVSGIGFVMLTSPFFRFSVPYILVLLAISGSVVWADRSLTSKKSAHNNLDPSSTPTSAPNFLWAIGLALVTLCLVLHRSTLLLPPPMVFSSTWVTRMTNGIEYFAPQSGDVQQETVTHKDMCWNAPIPCAYTIAPSVYLRDHDRGIAGGFVRRGP